VFTLRGRTDGVEITPRTIGLSLFNQFNGEVESFIAGSQRDVRLNDAHVQIEEGSYQVRVLLSTALMAALAPDLRALEREDSLGEIDPKRAETVLKWQERARRSDSLSYNISAPDELRRQVVIARSTNYREGETSPWVEIEKYLFGRVVDMGGTHKANVHLALEGSGGTMIVGSCEDFLREQKDNRLYHRCLLRVKARQNVLTGKLRDIQLLDFIDYNPTNDEAGLERFIEQGTRAWADVPDAAAWVRELRGGR